MESGGGLALPIAARRARKGFACVAMSRSTNTITERRSPLNARLNELLASQPSCPNDVNLDGVVNLLDVDQWGMFSALTRYSSWADINQDGRTNNDDLDIILQKFGRCRK